MVGVFLDSLREIVSLEWPSHLVAAMLSFRILLPGLSVGAAVLVPAFAALPSFGPSIQLSDTVSRVEELRVADLDRDGDQDLLVIQNRERYDDLWAGGSGVTWWENTGFGNFKRAGEWSPGDKNMTAITIADLNDDGLPDLFVGYLNAINGEPTYAICPGAGMQGFLPLGPALAVTGKNPQIADFDGDGIPDISTSNGTWLGRGDGTFSAGGTLSVQVSDPGHLLDLTGDGLPDVLFNSSLSAVTMLRNLGGGTFGEPETLFTLSGNPTIKQVVGVSLPGVSSDPCVLVIYLATNQPMAALYAKQSGVYAQVSSLRLSTANLPQAPLLSVVGARGGSRVFISGLKNFLPSPGRGYLGSVSEIEFSQIGKPSMSFKARATFSGVTSHIAFADVDGDGYLDFMVDTMQAKATPSGLLNGAWQLIWYPGGASGTFAKVPREVCPPDSDRVLRFAGDLDGDGKVDLLTESGMDGFSAITLWRNRGGNAGFDRSVIFSSNDGAHILDVRDLDGDGRPDILLLSSILKQALGRPNTNILMQLTSLGGGKFRAQTLFQQRGVLWTDLLVEDGNQDGIPDLHYFTLGPVQEGWIPATAPWKFNTRAGTQLAGFPLPGQVRVDIDWNGSLDTWDVENRSFTLNGVQYPSPLKPASYDFDGDGRPDYVLDDIYRGELPFVAVNNTDPSDSYYPAVPYSSFIFPRELVNYLDLSGDGVLVGVYASLDPNGGGSSSIVARELGAAPGAAQTLAGPIHSGREIITRADVDGDGVPDLVVSSAAAIVRLEWFKGQAP